MSFDGWLLAVAAALAAVVLPPWWHVHRHADEIVQQAAETDAAVKRAVDRQQAYAELTEWVRRARTEGWYEDDPRWEHVEALLDRIDDLAAGRAVNRVAG